MSFVFLSTSTIWTDDHSVYAWRSNHYQLKGNILQGNLSLTIEHALESDSGPYCCRVVSKKWFSLQVLTFLLDVRAESPTSPPMRPTATVSPKTVAKSTTRRHAAISARPLQAPKPTGVSTSTPSIPAHTPEDWDDTMTRSSHDEGIPTQKPLLTTTKELIVGISIAAVLLLVLVSVAVAKCLCVKKKTGLLSWTAFRICKMGVLHNMMLLQPRVQVEDQDYIIENSLSVMD